MGRLERRSCRRGVRSGSSSRSRPTLSAPSGPSIRSLIPNSGARASSSVDPGRVEDLTRDGVAFVFNMPNRSSGPGYLKMGWAPVRHPTVYLRPRVRPGSIRRTLAARGPSERWSMESTAGVAAPESLRRPGLRLSWSACPASPPPDPPDAGLPALALRPRPAGVPVRRRRPGPGGRGWRRAGRGLCRLPSPPAGGCDGGGGLRRPRPRRRFPARVPPPAEDGGHCAGRPRHHRGPARPAPVGICTIARKENQPHVETPLPGGAADWVLTMGDLEIF